MKLTNSEVIDIGKAWIGVTLAFQGGTMLAGSFSLLSFLFTFLIVGGAVILHELGHKAMAQRFGVASQFKSNDSMLLFGVVIAILTGFVFLAPGAVHLSRAIPQKETALIAWAGPAVNGLLALLSLPFTFLELAMTGWFETTLLINAFLGLFNMIPFPGFDGQKVLAGDKTLYWGTVGILGILLTLRFI